MLSVAAMISAFCPDLAALDAGVQAVWIQIAEESVNRPIFGDNANRAVALLACHLFTINTNGAAAGGIGGIVTFEREGQVSRSYATPNMDDETALKSTVYGMQFIELRRQSILTPRTRREEIGIWGFPYGNY